MQGQALTFSVSIASLTITNSRGKVLLSVVPNVYPATRVIARKEYGDESLVEYVQVNTPLIEDATGVMESGSIGPRLFPDVTSALIPVQIES